MNTTEASPLPVAPEDACGRISALGDRILRGIYPRSAACARKFLYSDFSRSPAVAFAL